MVIILSPPDLSEAGFCLEENCMIYIPNLEMEMCSPSSGRLGDERVQQLRTYAAPLRIAAHGEQKQLGFARNDSAESETERRVGRAAREHHPDAGQRQEPSALRRRPGLSESGVEAFAHHGHDFIEVARAG